MAQTLKWGILATGGIARQFSGGLRLSQTGTLVATGSRTQENADKFAAEYGGRGHGSYEDLLADPEVEAVYISLPHHLHYEWTIKTAQAGKAILCEKPFTLNALEAERALAAVKENDVFFMEAFMYRCSPRFRKALELVRDGAIGELRAIQSEFSYHGGANPNAFRNDGALGGGGLMDVGAYPVSLARAFAGVEPTSAHYTAKLSDNGYDEWGSGCLGFPNGVTCHFGCGVHLNMRNGAILFGSEGSLEMSDPWKVYPSSKMVLRRNGNEPEEWGMGLTNDELYMHEADAVAEFVEAKECPYMSVEDTLGQMRTLDALRKSAGMHFAAELTE